MSAEIIPFPGRWAHFTSRATRRTEAELQELDAAKVGYMRRHPEADLAEVSQAVGLDTDYWEWLVWKTEPVA